MPDLAELQKEWGVITGAPWLFGGALLLFGGVIWFFITQINSGTIAGKTATIEALKTQNDAYRNKLSGASPEEAKARMESLEARLSKNTPVYEAWRHVEKFTLFEAASLWTGREPSGGSRYQDVGAWESALCDAIRTG